MQHPPIVVRPATAADVPVVAAMLARAFIDDPAMDHLFPGRSGRPARLLRFFTLILRSEDDIGATMVAGDAASATIWRPPGAWRTSPSKLLRFAGPMIATFGSGLPRALRLMAAVEAIHPAAPHWYLEVAGTDPGRQGRGYGGAAIRSRLAACDAERLPAYLETATAANVGWYESFGFRTTARVEVIAGLPIWSMWREPGGTG